ncbi:DUF5714 domain-containing protein [Desulfuromonas thiophila]|uniref:DUF5714 domain-containing protein n=1 Tax=Desulfuromonas thiophila TaxID=57664 RepID=UPI0024A9964B|nr:DUF5714 domain-containing protein [Desulfuromonas thiophila]
MYQPDSLPIAAVSGDPIFDVHRWLRLSHHGIPIYLYPEGPHWFVPSRGGDALLQQLRQNRPVSLTAEAVGFLQRLPQPPVAAYAGRAACLQLSGLQELWLHITNRCNLRCRHCLFASAADSAAELPLARLCQRIDEARALGCRLFALTGGEPTVHRDFVALVDHVLADPAAHVAVLTNGMALERLTSLADWPRDRLHWQISVDGLQARHDGLRGAGSFARLRQQLAGLRQQGWPFTLSMCVEADNLADMAAVVELAADWGAANVHFMWYFVRGRGGAERFADPGRIAAELRRALGVAERRGVRIDNLDALRTQLFAPPGTRHDGSGAGWQALAIGPDDRLYPSAALVDVAELATDLTAGLAAAWRDSAALTAIRHSSCATQDSPWRFLLGGGDLDHSYLHGGCFSGADPYLPLYEELALDLLVASASRQPDSERPLLRLKMGDVLESCGAHGAVALLHSNCLLALSQNDSRTVVKDFYAAAVGDRKEEILNPVCYDADLIDHIPEAFRFRGYGCGSPVLDAAITAGQTVLDLGCGSGVECFIAARLTGRQGRVIGVDMLAPMLELARQGAVGVAARLGYDNLEFHQAYLEALPLADASVDLILSNCVLNLSADKRCLFAEMWRVLKPGGRLVVADVVCESEPDAAIRNDEQLRGECIAGALTQKDLFGLLAESGFVHSRCLKRLPYRQVQGHAFFSLTFEAQRPALAEAAGAVRVLYPGPFASIGLEDGRLLFRGQLAWVSRQQAEAAGELLYQLEEDGTVANIAFSYSCNCALPARESDTQTVARQLSGCMLCGAPLLYAATSRLQRCHYCGRQFDSSVCCEQGHHVCDACHNADALAVIAHLCQEAEETELLPLFYRICRHPAIPLHGPQFHALVPAVILACYRNQGGTVSAAQMHMALQRGSQVMGGSCAFNGVCGAAVGVGIALSLLLEATPLTAVPRQQAQQLVQQVLAELAAFRAARCCQRDCVVALCKAAELSAAVLPQPLRTGALEVCRQQARNPECLGAGCPLSPAARRRQSGSSLV